MKTRCNETICRHNRGTFCIKRTILVKKQAQCISFEKGDNVYKDAEFAFETHPFGSGPSPLVVCEEASCKYNFQRRCEASKIDLARTNGIVAHCRTYTV